MLLPSVIDPPHSIAMSQPALPIVLALMLPMSLAPAAVAADGSVTVERLQGQAQQVQDRISKNLVQGAAVEVGTRIRTDARGRVELSVNGIPTLSAGSDVELLVHSYEATVVRARLSQGTMHIDARSAPGRRSRDVRLNVGELRVRIADAEAWAQQTQTLTQVCLVSAGVVEVKQAEQLSRIDLQGQCLRVAEATPSWTRVPAEVLSERIELTKVATPGAEPRRPVTAAIAPAVPAAAAPAVPAAVAPAAPVVVAPAAVETAVVAPVVSAPVARTKSAAADDGRSWSVVLASVGTQQAADLEAARLKALGVLQAEVRAYRNGDRSGFRVGAGRYVSREEAGVALTQFKKHYPNLNGWLARY